MSDELTIPGPDAVDFWPTKPWFAEMIFERKFSDLDSSDVVLEPTAGDGAFLRVIPAHIDAYGVELDETLAAEARRTSGRDVITGDILKVDLPRRPSAVLGNPPYTSDFLDPFLARMEQVLDEGSRMVLLLSVHLFQTSRTVARYADHWALDLELVPRDIFQGLQRPLVLATLTKSADRRIVGMAFAREIADMKRIPERYRAILERSKTNVWVRAIEEAIGECGRPLTIDELYETISHNKPTRTTFVREAIRKWTRAAFTPVGPATYDIPKAA